MPIRARTRVPNCIVTALLVAGFVPSAAPGQTPAAEPQTPETRPLTAAEASQALEQDWLFQAMGEPLAARAAKEIGWAQWQGKNGVGVVVGTVALPAGSYEVSLLHSSCSEHTGGTGNTFKTAGGAQKFILKAPDPDDPVMYVVFVARGGGGIVAISGGIHIKGIAP